MGVKAKATRVGPNLILVETEYGQKCVVPEQSLCELVARYGLEIVEGETIKCNTKIVGSTT